MADTPAIVTTPIWRPGRDLAARRDDLERDRQMYDGYRRQLALLEAAQKHEAPGRQ